MSKIWPAKSSKSAYLVAVITTAFVLLLRFALSGILGDAALFFPFVIAITISAWYGGLKAGLVATFLSAIAAVYFFVPPYYTLRIEDAKIAATLVFFVIASVTISLVCDALHAARRRVELSEAAAMQHLSDLERRDRALRDAQDQLHMITDSMSALVTRCTRDLKYSWVSRPYADWLKQPREKIVGAAISDVIGRTAFAALRPYYESVLRGETVRLEQEVDFLSLGPRWINAVYTPTMGSDGVPDGWVGVVIDIDAQKRSEAALRATDRRKDNFLAILAHELRNPLAPLRSSLAILKQPTADPTVAHQARNIMERQLSHMVRLVDDLLDLSRINSDKLELQKQPVLLTDVVSQAVETVRPLIIDANHELIIELPKESIQLNADTVRLSQAFANLLNNACKFTQSGGRISLSSVCEDGHVLVTIRDNGQGIPADLNTNIFEMFTQGNQNIERQHGGLGIGLALVKRLVEMHDGEVSARSNPDGPGSEFVVRLPLSLDKSAKESNTLNASGVPIKPLQVLVVDDNVDTAESLCLFVQMAGNIARTANDGEEALNLANQFKPDVVLLDVGLPKLNGYDVAKAIRQQEWGRRTMLIAITGWGQVEDKARSREAGFDHHLVKPIDPETLITLIKENGGSLQF